MTIRLFRAALLALLAPLFAACGAGGGDYAPSAAVVAPVAPAITSAPTSQTVTAGQNATFSVVATGTAPLTYQWRRNGVDIAGATAASYTLAATSVADDGALFSVRVGNAAGNVTSGNALLTVNAAPTAPAITQQPASASVQVGASATFNVAASGTAPIGYQWRRDGVPIAGATVASYTLANAQLADNGASFDAVVSNAAGSATSNAATLTVSAAPPPPPSAAGLCHPSGATTTCWVEPQPHGLTIYGLAISATTGVATTGRHLLRTTDGGLTWSIVSASDTVFLQSVAMSGSVVLAAGTDNSTGSGAILRSTDSGQTWAAVTLPAGVQELRSVRFVGASTAFALGASRILRSTDSGATWSIVSTAAGLWTGIAFNPASTIGVAVRDNGAPGTTATLRSTDGGQTWAQSATTGGWDVDYSDAFIATGHTIQRSTDGIAWTAIASGTTNFLYSVSFRDSSTGLAAGTNNTLLRSTDGGLTWTAQPAPALTWRVVRWRTLQDAIVLGTYGATRRSGDAGLTWSNGQTRASAGDLRAVAHNGAGVALVSGNTAVIRSTDSGANWVFRVTGTGERLHGVAFASANVAVAVGEAGTIARSTDGGLNWSAATSGTTEALLDVHFGSASNGVAVGTGGTIVRSSDGGATWSAATSGTASAIASVRFASANVAVAIAADGAVLRSTDGGATWTQVASSAAGSYVRFASANVGLIAGGAGQNLRSVDGGATWFAVTLGDPNETLFAFDFHSATSGVGVMFGPVSAYVSTNDGGASFTSIAALPNGVSLGVSGWALLSPTRALAVVFDSISSSVFAITFP